MRLLVASVDRRQTRLGSYSGNLGGLRLECLRAKEPFFQFERELRDGNPQPVGIGQLSQLVAYPDQHAGHAESGFLGADLNVITDVQCPPIAFLGDLAHHLDGRSGLFLTFDTAPPRVASAKDCAAVEPHFRQSCRNCAVECLNVLHIST